MIRCPYCRFSGRWKPGRPSWMHWTPGPMRNVRCNRCGHEYAIWLGFIPLRHRTAQPLVKLWNWILISAIVLALAFVLPKVLAP